MLRSLIRRFLVSEPQYTSIYETNPEYGLLVTNESFNITPVKPRKDSKRTGLLAIKQGMTAMWDRWGVRHALTVLQVDRCQVTQIKTREKDGYNALQLGVGEKKLHRVNKPYIGHCIKANVPPKQKLVECKVTADCLLPLGYELDVRHFIVGQSVDVQGVTKGKGFQGGIRRWNFHRQTVTHGNSKTTRQIGSTGQHTDPARTFPGKKMPGHLGCEKATIHKLKIYKIDYERNLLFVKGAVPGNRGGVVRVQDSNKDLTHQYRKLPFPTYIPSETEEFPKQEVMPAPEEDYFETRMFLHDNAVPNRAKDEGP